MPRHEVRPPADLAGSRRPSPRPGRRARLAPSGRSAIAVASRTSSASACSRYCQRNRPESQTACRLVCSYRPSRSWQVVAAAVVAVGDVQGLVQVLHEVDEEAERLAAAGPGGVGIGQHRPEFGDLADDTALPRAEPITVMGGGDRHVDVMPGGGAADPGAVLVGPGRGVGQRFPRLEQVPDDRPRPGREPRLGQPRRGPVAQPSPGPGPRGHRRDQGPDQESDHQAQADPPRPDGRGQRRNPARDRTGPAGRIAGTAVVGGVAHRGSSWSIARRVSIVRGRVTEGTAGPCGGRRAAIAGGFDSPSAPTQDSIKRVGVRRSRVPDGPMRSGTGRPGPSAGDRGWPSGAARPVRDAGRDYFPPTEKGSEWRRSTPTCPARAAAARSSSGAARRSKPTPSAPSGWWIAASSNASLKPLEEGLARFPDNAWLLTRKAIVEVNLKRLDAAKATLQGLLGKNPGHVGGDDPPDAAAAGYRGPRPGHRAVPAGALGDGRRTVGGSWRRWRSSWGSRSTRRACRSPR